VRFINDESLYQQGIWASRFNENQWKEIEQNIRDKELSAFEKIALFSVKKALDKCDIDLGKTQFILSTTKGNIETLGLESDERNRLTTSARLIAKAAGFTLRPKVISHACVSGVASLIYGMRLLDSGALDNVAICGADRLTRFVLSGFSSFLALADEPCKPFDAARKGINLGEAAATLILSKNAGTAPLARLLGGATSNDANHISGPSRTGNELALAISRALNEANIDAAQIAAISAHGTATLYNDEMESKAFATSNLLHAPVHSLKGFLGHTLGAAGVLESVMLIESMRHSLTIPSIGFENLGVPHRINVSAEALAMPIPFALKTASGFGGCNAALVFGGK
ncbi:MAG: beta-ketoacyl synthase N-terminal-like domain-containing protein, partial [Chitinophagaceae bacterium]